MHAVGTASRILGELDEDIKETSSITFLERLRIGLEQLVSRHDPGDLESSWNGTHIVEQFNEPSNLNSSLVQNILLA